MVIITDYIKKIARIECSCCSDIHYLDLIKEKEDKNLYLEINDILFFWQRVNDYFKIFLNKESYISGKNRDTNQIIVTKNQLKELADVLYNEGYQERFINYEIKDLNEFLIYYYEVNNFILAKEKDSEIYYLIIHLSEEDNIWRFTKKCDTYLSKEEVEQFLYIINHL